MKNKFIVFLALVLFLAPISASAEKILHTTIYTDQGDGIFHFQLATYLMNAWWDNGSFDVITTNQVGAGPDKKVSEAPPGYNPARYYIEEITPEDYALSKIDCYCDNEYHAPGIFSYSNGNRVYIYPTGDSSVNCSLNFYCNFYHTKKRTPVLIVPGLLGTEMKKGDELLWADVDRMFTDIGDSFMNDLEFKGDLSPLNNNIISTSVIKKLETALGLINFDYTEGLINEFNGQGYVEGQSLFTFPYDWRYGVTGMNLAGKTNSELLAEKINEIKQQTGASKVDVMAHSLGGLITKKYVMDNPINNYIGKVVFVGVPNTGAPKAAKTLLQGDNFGVLGLNDQTMKKISENMPSAYDLLPSQQYYDSKGSYIRTIDQTKCFGDHTIPCEVKDLNYQESNDFLNSHGFNSLGIDNALNLHTQNFDNFDMRTAGVDLYNIVGCKTATLGKVIQTKYNDIFGQQFNYKLRLVPGDKTVPLESAINLPIDLAKKYYALDTSHGKMPSQNGIRQKIVNLISGSNLDIGTAYGEPLVTQDISKCQLTGKSISVFSPVDIFITDQNGNKLGLAEDGSIMNEISGADFEIWGEHKFLYLPQDGGQTYNVSLKGTGTGTYTVKSQDINNSQVIKAEIFSDLPVTLALTGQVNIGLDGTTLSVKQNPNDVSQTILPIKILDFLADKTSPEVIIYFDSTVKDLKFSATDNLSDIFSISVTDNNGAVVLTDEAGNITEINFKERNRRAAMSAEITSIKYNGVPVSISSNLLSYSWSFDKSGNLAKLVQKVKSRNNYSITATYDGINTKITGTTSAGRISQSFLGLKVIKVTTNKGDLSWSY